MADLFTAEVSSTADISACGRYRHCLTRNVGTGSLTAAFFGVNPSTADATLDDATVRKWLGFSRRNDIGRFIVGNVFDYRATDVRELGKYATPRSPNYHLHIASIIERADVLIPCWGDRGKVPQWLRRRFDELRDLLWASGKPVKVFGFTKGGDPLHPLMLGYSTPLQLWEPKGAHHGL